MGYFRRYTADNSGNFGLIFGIMILPLLIAVGAAIDYSRISSSYTKLRGAADTAALGAALAYMEDGQKKMREKGHETLMQNASDISGLVISDVKIKKTQANTIKVTSKGTLDPMFVQVFGYPKLNFNVTSEASLATIKGMEIAIAFDSTNSMNFDSRWNNAMSAINNTLKDMKKLTGKKNFYASLVPFADRVNIGTANSSWLSGPAPSGWTGCVEPREEVDGSFNWAVDNDNPSSEPFTASISGVTGGMPSLACPAVAITGPTKKPNEIIAATKSMTHGGTGRFDVGMAWAWRLVSPEWRGRWGVSNYPANEVEDIKKKIIFVSDGNSEAYTDEMSMERSWGHNQGSIVAFEHLVELCTKIKGEGIEIYMLKVDGNPNADSYFQQCASTARHYYSVTEAADITIAFTDILDELYAELRLVR